MTASANVPRYAWIVVLETLPVALSPIVAVVTIEIGLMVARGCGRKND